jgi:TIR domain
VRQKVPLIARRTVHHCAPPHLGGCKNLDAINHDGPSTIDIRTLQRSGPLPLAFLRGVGLPDKLIDYLPSLLDQATQFYSVFISYSTKDEEFARRLHADLQNNGVRCWFDAEDMKIGAKIRDVIEEAIRLRDKVLLVLSEASIASTWVEGEVEKAFEEERQRGGLVLFPVRLDDVVLTTKAAWAGHLRRTRHIGDFRAWKDHDAYQHTLERLLRELRVEAT